MKKKIRKTKFKEIHDYDGLDTSSMINRSKPIRFEDVGFKLPPIPPTQVVSIRLPSHLLNEIKAFGSQEDIPYQALIKLFLAKSMEKLRNKKYIHS